MPEAISRYPVNGNRHLCGEQQFVCAAGGWLCSLLRHLVLDIQTYIHWIAAVLPTQVQGLLRSSRENGDLLGVIAHCYFHVSLHGTSGCCIGQRYQNNPCPGLKGRKHRKCWGLPGRNRVRKVHLFSLSPSFSFQFLSHSKHDDFPSKPHISKLVCQTSLG